MPAPSPATSFVPSLNASNGWKKKRKPSPTTSRMSMAKPRRWGFDTKVLRKVVAIRKQDENDRLEQEAILDTYLHAFGMAPANLKARADPIQLALPTFDGSGRPSNRHQLPKRATEMKFTADPVNWL
jgi:hypothetical protein